VDWLWKAPIGCDGIEEVALRRPSNTPGCSELNEFFRSPFAGVDMISLPFLVRSVDDEPDFISTGSVAGRSSTTRSTVPVVSLVSGLAGHRFAGGHFIDLNGTLEDVTL
jgi:hypothetical protein